ncbi:uncharacterized [Tachysurus ichikawai]
MLANLRLVEKQGDLFVQLLVELKAAVLPRGHLCNRSLGTKRTQNEYKGFPQPPVRSSMCISFPAFRREQNCSFPTTFLNAAGSRQTFTYPCSAKDLQRTPVQYVVYNQPGKGKR